MAEFEIRFDKLDQPQFDRVVEAVLIEEFTGNGFRAQPLDGRGGDGGIDVGVWDMSKHVVRIFQLKCFPEGFSGMWRPRRKQVQVSFDSAMKNHHSKHWTLVIPGNPSREEREFVLGLRGDRDMQTDIIGRAELDNLLGKHSHLLEVFASDRVLRFAQALGKPEEALAHSDDLGVVLDRVHGRLRAQSPHWGWAFSVDAHGNQMHQLVPRHPDAHIAEPLAMEMTATFTKDTEDLREQFDRAMRFGVAETIVLPHDVVPSISRSGADWFAGEKPVEELHLVPLDAGAGTPVSLVAQDSEGVQIGSIAGTVKRFARGAEGGQLIVDFIGGLVAHWIVPTDTDAPPQDVTFTTSNGGVPVREVRRLTRFMGQFDSAHRVAIRVKGHDFAAFTLGGGDRHEPDPALLAFVDDLVFIEDELDVQFLFPREGVSTADRRWAAALREVLKGSLAPMPNVDGYNMTLDGGYDDALLAGLRADGMRLFRRLPQFTRELLGVDVVLRDLVIHQHEAVVEDGEAHVAALQAGSGAGRVAHAVSSKKYPWLMYKPDRLKNKGHLPPLADLAVPGVPEHTGMSALRNRLEADAQLVR
ncbi:hypothetical protein [Curtobacterium sp. VKM Ac-1393]|uniref:hypothetical protein n=1 Tax=Curtobacterium sp. VKM Ac-1393 TaxID=2783814 RepID=UPI00188A7F6F|nr:hypothetical protein [Curtobacterium sp. VKM Ac-1393]MBF4609235.1 hypothetical protein [Curtobacterium sp. VKM Ac-1393]